MNDGTDNDIKKSRGRPRVASTPIMVRLEEHQLRKLDDWRRQQGDLPGRPAAIRTLIDLGIANAYEFQFAAHDREKREARAARRAAKKRESGG